MKCSMKFIIFITLFLVLAFWSIQSNAVVLNIDKVENQPLPTETTIIILDDNQNEIAREKTDDKGVLVVDLPDGNYSMQTEDGKEIGFIGLLGGIPTISRTGSPGTPPRKTKTPEKSAEGPSGKPSPEKGIEDSSGKPCTEKVTEGPSHKPFVGDDVVKANQPEIKKVTEPILEDMPSGGGLGGKIAGGLLGGFAGMGGFSAGGSGEEEPEFEDKPKGPWTRLEGGPKGKTKVDLTASLNDAGDELSVGMKVKKARGKGSPHLILLQHEDGMIIQPYLVLIFELWGEFTLSVTTWKETYQDGQLVSREHMGTSTSSWKTLMGRYTAVIEGPAIWQRLGTGPFKKIRGVIAKFKIPAGFDPSKWSLIAHVTGKGKDAVTGKKIIKTVPFIADFGEDLQVIGASNTRFQRIH